MLISRNWLQNYFDQTLPSAQDIADVLMLHAFEVEDVFEKNNDWIIDIDVLPNRAHDCLCHFGVARELGVLLSLPVKTATFPKVDKNDIVPVQILNTDQCTRYQATRINNVQVGADCFEDYLIAMGQKSINNLVNISNVVMFDYGQPTHIFDADKISGGITVRNALEGETMTTLSGEELVLTPSDLVVADDEAILALAGVKGGTKAEVTKDTKNIVVEVAHFSPVTTRKTARRVKILTDSSKRYENEITAEKVDYAMEMMVSLISTFAATSDMQIVGTTDIYPKQELQHKVSVSSDHVQRLLGLDISESEISDILDRCGYSYNLYEGLYTVTIPADRLGLRIAEDIVEEIGRIYGYHNIPTQALDSIQFTPHVEKSFFGMHALTNFLVEKGLSNVMTYTFVKNGDIEMFNPLASDKKALRKNLTTQITEAAERNMYHADFLGVDRIMIFEIGYVYTSAGESRRCCIAIANKNKSAKKKHGTEQDQLETLISDIESEFSVQLGSVYNGNTVSFDMSGVQSNTVSFDTASYAADALYHDVSVYPYVTRDVSFWAPSGTSVDEYRSLITMAGGDFLKKVFLFDEFEKDGKTSYAFSMVFQSNNTTLTDDQVDSDMQKIIQSLEGVGCEVR